MIAIFAACLSSCLFVWAPIGGYLADCKGAPLAWGYAAGFVLGPLGCLIAWYAFPEGPYEPGDGDASVLAPLVIAGSILSAMILICHATGYLY